MPEFDWSVQPGPENRWVLFDEWRRQYDDMTLEDQQDFHTEFYKRWTVIHQHGDDRPVFAFFDGLDSEPDIRVLEIGGWTGEAADAVLRRHLNVSRWLNIEFTREAVANPRTTDPRYEADTPDGWPWLDSFGNFNVLFMQHVIEHMKHAQFEALLGAAPDAKWVFIQSPLEMDGVTWEGYPGCHILEVGWTEIDLTMERAGFTLVQSWWDTEYSTAKENGRTRIYKRISDAV